MCEWSPVVQKDKDTGQLSATCGCDAPVRLALSGT
jgi:hypothetical protein